MYEYIPEVGFLRSFILFLYFFVKQPYEFFVRYFESCRCPDIGKQAYASRLSILSQFPRLIFGDNVLDFLAGIEQIADRGIVI